MRFTSTGATPSETHITFTLTPADASGSAIPFDSAEAAAAAGVAQATRSFIPSSASASAAGDYVTFSLLPPDSPSASPFVCDPRISQVGISIYNALDFPADKHIAWLNAVLGCAVGFGQRWHKRCRPVYRGTSSAWHCQSNCSIGKRCVAIMS